MKRKIPVLKFPVFIVLNILIGFFFCTLTVAQNREIKGFVPGEIIIQFHPNQISAFNRSEQRSLKELEKKLKSLGMISCKPLFKGKRQNVSSRLLSSVYLARFPRKKNIHPLIRYIKNFPSVKHAEPNYIHRIFTIPDDPDFSLQWALHNIAQSGGTEDADVDAPESWDVEQGNSAVVIAVVDTGVDYTHTDLIDNLWHNPGEVPDNGIDDDDNGYVDDTVGWDFVDISDGGHAAPGEDISEPDNDTMDFHGHGTHVAGIAGAVTNNGTGIAGVAWNCQIMPVRAGYKTASGDGLIESDDAAQAIVYAAENGAKVVNLSWGDEDHSQIIEDAINHAVNLGALICAAAGNYDLDNFFYPAALENTAIIAVGATNDHDQKWSFSNYGSWVDVSAPGVDIYSSLPQDTYGWYSGTSIATPHVSGLAALILSHFPGINPIGTRARIMHTADVLLDLDGMNSTSGRINFYTALTENINLADISLKKEVDNATVDVFETVTFTLTVTNYGPDNATHIVVEDPLPSGLTYVSDNSEGSYNPDNGTWEIGALDNGTSTVLQVAATVDDEGTVTNHAWVISSYPTDDNATNDSDDAVVTGFQSPDTEDQDNSHNGHSGGGSSKPSPSDPQPECETDADCMNDVFCDGAELCVDGICLPGIRPCVEDEICVEDKDECVTPEPPPDCWTDGDCDDRVFCNGPEKCIEGECVSGEIPCEVADICIEDAEQCWDYETIFVRSIQKTLSRPLIQSRKCPWLVLRYTGACHFNKRDSVIRIQGPLDDAQGVTVDPERSAFEVQDFIFVPICIEKNAEVGEWFIRIETDVTDTDSPFREVIEYVFEIK